MRKLFFKPKKSFDWMDFVTMVAIRAEFIVSNDELGDVRFVVNADYQEDPGQGIYTFTAHEVASESGVFKLTKKKNSSLAGYFSASIETFFLEPYEPRLAFSAMIQSDQTYTNA